MRSQLISRVWSVVCPVCWAVLLGLLGHGCNEDERPTHHYDGGLPDGTSPLCGNGTIDEGEECDDGNTDPYDGCSPNCQIVAECGNGLVEPGEDCDGLAATTCVQMGYLTGDHRWLCSFDCQLDLSVCLDDHPDLVGWYELDGTSGAVVDNSSKGNDCSAEGGLERDSTGFYDRAFYFNGIDAYADCGVGTGLDGIDALTVEAWVKLTSYSPEGMFVSRAVTADASGIAWFVGVTGEFRWGAEERHHWMFGIDPRDDVVFTGDVVQLDRWHHVAGVYDGTSITIYLNGEEHQSAATVHTGPLSAPAGARTFLGHLLHTGGSSPWDTFMHGYIDEVKIWRIARTQEEICADAGGWIDYSGSCVLPFE